MHIRVRPSPAYFSGLRFFLIVIFYFFGLLSYATEESAIDEPAWNFTIKLNGELKKYRIPKTEMARETIEIGGRPLHFVEVYKDRDKAPKPLILFVHGTPGGWFDQVIFLTNDFMRDNFHMIAVDRFGHGDSEG